jgi:hypothetical protein
MTIVNTFIILISVCYYRELCSAMISYTKIQFLLSGGSLDMYICIHVRDKGIYSRGI